MICLMRRAENVCGPNSCGIAVKRKSTVWLRDGDQVKCIMGETSSLPRISIIIIRVTVVSCKIPHLECHESVYCCE